MIVGDRSADSTRATSVACGIITFPQTKGGGERRSGGAQRTGTSLHACRPTQPRLASVNRGPALTVRIPRLHPVSSRAAAVRSSSDRSTKNHEYQYSHRRFWRKPRRARKQQSQAWGAVSSGIFSEGENPLAKVPGRPEGDHGGIQGDLDYRQNHRMVRFLRR